MSNSGLVMAMWFFGGVLYGLIMMSTIGSWVRFVSTVFYGYEHGKEVTTYKTRRIPKPRLFFIVIAGTVWPLTSAFAILYGVLRLPLALYRKTTS